MYIYDSTMSSPCTLHVVEHVQLVYMYMYVHEYVDMYACVTQLWFVYESMYKNV